MPITNRSLPLLNRKEFQFMTPVPVTPTTGYFITSDPKGEFDFSFYMTSATVHYLYSHDEDSYAQIPSGAFAGTFGAGSCGEFHPWSIAYTANGGSTTTITVSAATHNINNVAKDQTVEFISSGTNSGLRRTITNVVFNPVTGNITLTLSSAVSTAVLSGHTFRISSGRFFVMNAGTVAAGSFKVFDVGTMAWQASLATTNLPATWGTDGQLTTAYVRDNAYASGTATSATGTTLVNSAKTWATNQWTNYQVRITAGTGIGQVRTIASNTGTTLTVATWTTTPDATSEYEIEANEDFLYLLGNNVVTMYRYSISANAWTVMAPTTARTAAPSSGMSSDVAIKTGNATWADESNILDGKYIYSFRGGTSSVLDRFDIAGGTAGAGAWAVVNSVIGEVFSVGSSYFIAGNFLYARKDATNRFFKYSISGNLFEPLAVHFFAEGTTVVGQKTWHKKLDSAGTVQWLYTMANNAASVHRMMLY